MLRIPALWIVSHFGPFSRLDDITYLLFALKPPPIRIFAVEVQSDVLVCELQLLDLLAISLISLIHSDFLD